MSLAPGGRYTRDRQCPWGAQGQYNIGSAVIANLPTVDTAHATVEVTAGGDIFLTDGK